MQLWYIFHTPFQIIIPRSEFFSYLFLFQPDKKFDVVSLFFNERAYSLVFYSKCYLRSLNICLFVLKSQNFWKEAVSIKPCFIRFSFNFLQITCRFFVVYMPYSFCQNTCTQRLAVEAVGEFVAHRPHPPLKTTQCELCWPEVVTSPTLLLPRVGYWCLISSPFVFFLTM